MKKLYYGALASALLVFFLFSQANNQDNNEKYQNVATTGQIDMQLIPIEDFDDSSSWLGKMPRDMGIIRVQRREGGPGEIKELNSGNDKHFCLGAKIAFFKTGANWFAILPPREIFIKGVTRELNVWACGRNKSHSLSAIVRDIKYRLFKVPFGKMNFRGWQKMTAQVTTRIDQEDYKYITYENPRGLKFTSFLVECAMDETHGIYYIYLDELTSMSDVFLENPENQDPNDVLDNW